MPPSERRSRRLAAATAVLAVVVMGLGIGIVVRGDRGSGDSPALARGLAAALADAGRAEEPFPGLTEVELMVGDDCLHLVVADETDERVLGLRGRDDLGPYDGMLFVFEEPVANSFTMRGVPVPLDIGWYAASGAPVDRTEMEPCPSAADDCPSYAARSRYRLALETLGGELPAGGLSACPA